uniref:Uncharacterized protein n=1 Tax=Arundo donax TaxID=35708 RepID=A0A0A9GE63_ARUDO
MDLSIWCFYHSTLLEKKLQCVRTHYRAHYLSLHHYNSMVNYQVGQKLQTRTTMATSTKTIYHKGNNRQLPDNFCLMRDTRHIHPLNSTDNKVVNKDAICEIYNRRVQGQLGTTNVVLITTLNARSSADKTMPSQTIT